jgi:plasmid stabilization system protein ParE
VNYIINPDADQDFDDIWEFIAQDSVDSADRWDAALREAFALLGRNPAAGHTRRDLTEEAVLFWPVDRYLIIYRPHPLGVEILAVTQGSRNIPSWLRKRS